MNRLKIFGYEAIDGGIAAKSFNKTDPFIAQMSPGSLKINHSVNYNGGTNDSKKNGEAVPEQKYTGVGAQTLSFELVFDRSGVVADENIQIKTVTDFVEKFKETCYYYRGENHESPYVKIELNGKSLFIYKDEAYFSRIRSFDVNFVRFNESGEPIRAKINATFVGSMDPKTEAKIRDDQSPDLTHVITVKAGDTLPMLCDKIYGSRQMFHEVAKYNNLLSFRHIKPGTELVFPPIK